jgi:protein-S-isoprenylcysteine O-methyltransferase Ste14
MQRDEENVRLSGRLRLIALYLLIVALVVLSRPTPLSVNLGLAFIVVGEGIRIWAAGYLQKTVELVTSGPYRYTRNPLYLGRLLIFLGLCIMARMPYLANLAVLALGCLVFFAYYLPRKERVEPARLREIHGTAYERYFKAVPALFPTTTPFPEAATAGWSSERLLRNREHWMVAGLLGVWLLLLWIAYAKPEGLLEPWLSDW